MIARSHRFHGHNSLRFVYQHGRTARSQALAAKVTENKKRQTYRAAVVVSKKVSKSAVTRNRIRRRVYEQIRSLEPSLARPYDIVITVFHEQVATMSSAALQKAVKSLFQQLDIISKSSKSQPNDGHAIIEAKEN